MKLYSLQGEHLFLHCGREKCREINFMHIIVDGEIDSPDWKHLLEEFPRHLTKENPNAVVFTETVTVENADVVDSDLGVN